ncbi:MAG: hypothetical protein KDD66_15820 [Bdellovibrionales bacterium]|nr:hypothetical protein [Bdellovibrionales bacterium]
MNAIILIILGLIAVAALVEFLNRSGKGAGSGSESHITTAAEAGPTQTGRYRVQEMLRKTETTPKAEADPSSSSAEEEEESLPDPFDDNR